MKTSFVMLSLFHTFVLLFRFLLEACLYVVPFSMLMRRQWRMILLVMMLPRARRVLLHP